MRRLNPKLAGHRLKWRQPPDHCALREDELHLWVADLDEVSLTREFGPLLSPDEAERAARFHFERDRRNFIAARGLLRTLLSRYATAPATALQFNYSENGKPSLALSLPPGNLNFNLSHSDGLAVYAFGWNREIGIDVESLQPFSDMEEIAARCFPAKEQKALRSQEPAQQEKIFFRYWTRKEAALKCTGEGLSGAGAQIGEAPFDGIMHELEPAEGFLAALAVRGKPFSLKTWNVTESSFTARATGKSDVKIAALRGQ